MARETKAQREAREEGERLDRCMEYRSKYPERLMDALGRATKLGWEICVIDGKFRVADGGVIKALLPYSIGLEGWHYGFEELVPDIGIAEDKLKEEKRIDDIREAAGEVEYRRAFKAALEKLSIEEREAALEKLSEEEREALGL